MPEHTNSPQCPCWGCINRRLDQAAKQKEATTMKHRLTSCTAVLLLCLGLCFSQSTPAVAAARLPMPPQSTAPACKVVFAQIGHRLFRTPAARCLTVAGVR